MVTPDQPAVALAAALVVVSGMFLVVRRPGRMSVRLRGLGLTRGPDRPTRSFRPARMVALVAAVAVALAVPGWLGLAAGVLTGYLVDRAVRRLEPRDVRLARARAQGDLPFALDLMAAALRSGAPPGTAATTVGVALGGSLGDRLDRVGRALSLGSASAQAWNVLGDIPGAERFAAAAVRGSTSGAALAGSLSRLADDLRSTRIAELEARAHRAGVLVVLPLGLCFLPAFVLGGLVPVVLSMLGTVLP